MAIKVIVNYPQTEEGMELLRNRQAEVIVRSLRRSITKYVEVLGGDAG